MTQDHSIQSEFFIDSHIQQVHSRISRKRVFSISYYQSSLSKYEDSMFSSTRLPNHMPNSISEVACSHLVSPETPWHVKSKENKLIAVGKRRVNCRNKGKREVLGKSLRLCSAHSLIHVWFLNHHLFKCFILTYSFN